MTQEDKAILEQFPKYDNIPEHYVNSREYWDGIFKMETNRDTELHKKFSKLHEDIVQLVINFCRENNLNDISEFDVHADGLKESIEYGKWVPSTDSFMSIVKDVEDEETGWMLPDRKHPFLYEI